MTIFVTKFWKLVGLKFVYRSTYVNAGFLYCEDSSDKAHATFSLSWNQAMLIILLNCIFWKIFPKFFCLSQVDKTWSVSHWNNIRHVFVFFIPQLDNHEIKPGKNLKVNISVPNLRLFVGNIPKSKGKEEILEEFGKLTGKVNSRRVYLPIYLYLPVYLYCNLRVVAFK